MIPQEKLIQLAKRSVPSFKWAIGGAGLLALAAIVVGWKINLGTLFLVAGVLLVIAMAFIALNWIAKLKPGQSSAMAGFFAWSMLILFVIGLALVLSSAALNAPWPIRDWIARQFVSPSGSHAGTATGVSTTTAEPAESVERVETLALHWIVGPVPDATLETLFEAEVSADDSWYSDDNLKALSDAPRAFILAEQNRAIARQLLHRVAAAQEYSQRGTTLAVVELNAAHSVTLPFGALDLDEVMYPPGANKLQRGDIVSASSGIELLYPDSSAPYDDDPERDQALQLIRTRPRKAAPTLRYRRTGRRAELTLEANATAFADWIDKLPTAADVMTPLPAQFRIVLITAVHQLPLQAKQFTDIMSTLNAALTTGDGGLSATSRDASQRALRTTWLSAAANGRPPAFYRVDWQEDENLTTRGGPEEEREPACRVSLFTATRVSVQEFASATQIPEPAASVAPEGVLIFASDSVVSPHAERIRALIGSRPLLELPLHTDLDAALAWCRKTQPAVVILSPDAFGAGRVIEYRTFTRAALSGTIRANVLRLFRGDEDAQDVPLELMVSGFEEDAFNALVTANITGKAPAEQWSIVKNYLTEVL